MVKLKRSASRTTYYLSGLFRPAYGSVALVTRRQLLQLREAIDLLLKWEE